VKLEGWVPSIPERRDSCGDEAASADGRLRVKTVAPSAQPNSTKRPQGDASSRPCPTQGLPEAGGSGSEWSSRHSLEPVSSRCRLVDLPA